MEVLDVLVLKEVVDFNILLSEELSIVECIMQITGCIVTVYLLRYICIEEYYYGVILED